MDRRFFDRLRTLLRQYLADEIPYSQVHDALWGELSAAEERCSAESREPRDGLFVRTYWSLVQVSEPPQYRTSRAELEYLLASMDDPEQYRESIADGFYP